MPVVVLAQAWRGGPQHQIRRVLKGCNILADNQHIGRALGVARATSGTAAGEDAIVIATAVRRQAPVVTSDLTHVAESIGVKVRLYSVCHLVGAWRLFAAKVERSLVTERLPRTR